MREPSAKTPPPAPHAAWGWVIAGLCLLAYLGSGQSLAGNDATANVHLAPRLLGHATTYFTAADNPKMFVFAARSPYGWIRTNIRDWNAEVHGMRAREAFERGDIRMVGPRYYLVPTRHPGQYASTFGLGAGLFALPVMGLALLVTNLEQHVGLLWWLGKLAAALSVAATVLLLFRAGLRFLSARSAGMVALAYGLGSSAFSISSQALWQHGPCELFVALGAYHLLVRERRASDALCGFGFAMAVLCRPTSALVFASVATYLLLFDRRRVVRFALGALPVLIVLVSYHQYTFGSPWVFGEMGVGAKIAMTKTGSPDMWQTPLHVGLAGLLLSPARGLFLYSPIALFSVWGAWRAFRDPAWKELRPLAIAAVLQVLLAAKWFDWWGGWCFGYRVIVDVAILLGFLAFPIVAAVNRRPWRRAVFATLFAYSVGVQVIGAYVFDLVGWNAPVLWQVATPDGSEPMQFGDKASAQRFVRQHGGTLGSVTLNIDNPKYRGRLWSFVDSPLVYYFSNIPEARAERRRVIDRFLQNDG